MSRTFSYTSDRSSSSSSSSQYTYSSSFPGAPPSQAMTAAQMVCSFLVLFKDTANKQDYTCKPRSRPASITSVQTTSTTSTDKSCEDKFLSSDQTYSAYLREQAAAKRPKNVNVYTTCGRHSNEWLFSGWFRK